MSWIYEIRTPDDTVLKRIGGFPDREAAASAARADAKQMRPGPRAPQIGRMLVRWVTGQPDLMGFLSQGERVQITVPPVILHL